MPEHGSEPHGAGGGRPPEPGPFASWLLRLLDPLIREESFEPAFHDLVASTRRDGVLRDAAFRLGVLGLALECLRLQRVSAVYAPKRKGSPVRDFGLELRWALRGLLQRPGFGAVMVLTLALGIGATTAIFSVVNGVLLRPLPFEDPGRLATVLVHGSAGHAVSVSVPNLKNWRERNRTFVTMAAAAGWNVTERSGGRAEILRGEIVLGDFFETLGVAPLLGRVIPAGDTEAGATPVAVLSYGYWQRAHGADPAVLGRTLEVNGDVVTVVGVMPPGFGFPSETETDLYLPMGMMAASLPWNDPHSSFGAVALARLAPGVTLGAAQRDMDRVTRELEAEAGEKIASVTLYPLTDFYVSDVRSPVLVLMGAVFFVLLIASVNVANLLLTRAEGRRRETALRLALGASRGAILRQSFAESLMIALAGGIIGVGLAAVAVRVLVSRLGDAIPPIVAPAIRVDGVVLAFSAVIVVLGAFAFALLPAWRAARGPNLADTLREGGRTGTSGPAGRRVRSSLVVAEISLAIVLVIGAGLMIQTLAKLRAGDSGFSAEGVVTARVSLSPGSSTDANRWRSRFDDVLERVDALPGVQSTAAMLLLPLAPRSWELLLVPEGQPWGPREGESVLYNIVSLNYFETLGIPIVDGRNFEVADRDDTPPVAIIDETMAAKLWPGEDPIGKRIAFERAPESTEERPLPLYRTVVGVVPNIRHYDLREPSRIQVYVPLHQSLSTWGSSLFIAARSESAEPAAMLPAVRSAVREADPGAAITSLRTFDGYVSEELANERALSALLAAFGGLALVLAGIGVFGVMSILVATRSREIGVRLAMGARPAGVLLMVLRGSALLAATGTVIGLFAAGGLSRLIGSLLYGVSPLDARVYLGAAAFLGAVALTATLIPALRAARLDPMATLRQDA